MTREDGTGGSGVENMLAKCVIDRKMMCSTRLLSFSKIGVLKLPAWDYLRGLASGVECVFSSETPGPLFDWVFSTHSHDDSYSYSSYSFNFD